MMAVKQIRMQQAWYVTMAWWLWNKSAYNNYEPLYAHDLSVENCYMVVGERFKKN